VFRRFIMASGSATVINVNVGGILYTSTVETLTKEEGSVLHTMFAGGGHARCTGYRVQGAREAYFGDGRFNP
jgi:hypothetical protein